MNNLPSLSTIKQLHQLYRNPNSPLFLQSDTNRIYETIKSDAQIDPISRREISDFKASVETLSRDFEARTLRSRARYTSHRQWISFSPLSILLGKSRIQTLTSTCHRTPNHYLSRKPQLFFVDPAM